MRTKRILLVPVIAALFLTLSACPLPGDRIPDVNGWWLLTVEYKSCGCSDGTDCPAALLQFFNISFPVTRVFKVEFRFNEDTEALSATFYENDAFLFTMQGYLEDSGDFKVEISYANATAFFDGSFDGNSVSGRTEIDYSITAEVTCHGYGLFTGSRI